MPHHSPGDSPFSRKWSRWGRRVDESAAIHMLHYLKRDLMNPWLDEQTRIWIEEKIRYYESCLAEGEDTYFDQTG